MDINQCPYCGSVAYYGFTKGSEDETDFHWIKCGNCGYYQNIFGEQSQDIAVSTLINQWNRSTGENNNNENKGKYVSMGSGR